jgi:peptidoglycan/xylan/chitin deacetylase (PgdA/CDA1 family)
MLGSAAERCREIVRRTAGEGHELGNHLWEDRPSLRLSRAEFASQLLRTHEVLADHAPVSLMRPGSGLIRREQLDALVGHGCRCVLGSVYPYDVQLPAGRYLADDVLRRARPGSILVLHEGRADRSSVLDLLEVVLPGLRARGLEVVTVAELLALGPGGAAGAPR